MDKNSIYKSTKNSGSGTKNLQKNNINSSHKVVINRDLYGNYIKIENNTIIDNEYILDILKELRIIGKDTFDTVIYEWIDHMKNSYSGYSKYKIRNEELTLNYSLYSANSVLSVYSKEDVMRLIINSFLKEISNFIVYLYKKEITKSKRYFFKKVINAIFFRKRELIDINANDITIRLLNNDDILLSIHNSIKERQKHLNKQIDRTVINHSNKVEDECSFKRNEQIKKDELEKNVISMNENMNFIVNNSLFKKN